MPERFDLRLIRERSGNVVSIEESGDEVPSPAVVEVTREGDGYVYELQVEVVEGAWPVVTELGVRVKAGDGRAITSAGLRDIRYGQLQRACVGFLRRGARDGWVDETLNLYSETELLESIPAPDAEVEEDWGRYLPTLVFDTRPDSAWAMRSDPNWLTTTKANGARSDLALRSTAAIYRQALRDGQSPNALVERLLELPKSTASEWIGKARERGYLEKSPRKPRSDRRSDDA